MLRAAFWFPVKSQMHVKVTVFIWRVLSGSDPGYRIPPLAACRESSTMTTDTSSNVSLGATSNTDTIAGNSEPQSSRRHDHAHRSKIPTPPKRRNSQPPACNPSTTELSQGTAAQGSARSLPRALQGAGLPFPCGRTGTRRRRPGCRAQPRAAPDLPRWPTPSVRFPGARPATRPWPPSHLGPRPTPAPAVPGTARRGRSLRRSLSALGAPPPLPCTAQRGRCPPLPRRQLRASPRPPARAGAVPRGGRRPGRRPALPSPRAVPPPPAEEVAASAPALQLPARRPPTPRRPSRQLVRPTRPTFSLAAPGRHSAASPPTPAGTLGTRVPRAGLSPFGWRRRVGRQTTSPAVPRAQPRHGPARCGPRSRISQAASGTLPPSLPSPPVPAAARLGPAHLAPPPPASPAAAGAGSACLTPFSAARRARCRRPGALRLRLWDGPAPSASSPSEPRRAAGFAHNAPRAAPTASA